MHARTHARSVTSLILNRRALALVIR
jgi:hypothetical protein